METVATATGAVLITGGGLWADALAHVATKGGATLLVGQSIHEAMSLIATRRPSVVIAGPPLAEGALIEFCKRACGSSSGSVVLAAVNRADITLRRALAEAGAAKVCIVPSAGADLAVAMINAARLTTRAHARVSYAAKATVVTRDGRVAGTTRDLSEGGLCLERVPERVARGAARVEFGLPGDRRPVVVEAQVVWSGGGAGDFRAGLRFDSMSKADLVRIRAFVEHQPGASASFR